MTEIIDIGPQTFKAADGSVLCHQGVNYVPQEEADRRMGEGYADGHAKGYDAGHVDGYTQGYSDGEAQGYTQAQDEFQSTEE